MVKAVQKIILSASRDIPFHKLVLSQSNVRRLKSGVSIEDLADDIARRGLLQSLNVRPVLDAEGAETGTFEIPAGGRRYRALERLVKQKRLSKTVPIPCIVRNPGAEISAEEDSLAENVQRVALHPLDQFRAFKILRDQGAGEEEIAARFFVATAVVKQRLRLASVSEKLLGIYAEDGMTLEQLMAFTVTRDHARQEQVWEALQQSYNKEPYLIRRQLTESAVRASDRRAQFVGLDAYEAAGGMVLRDLFEEDGGGWLQDVALLDSLVTEKLAMEAEKIAAEGWKWIEVAVDFRYGHARHLRRLDGVEVELTPDEQATFDALTAEQAKLESEYESADELPDEVDARLGEIEEALAAFDSRPVRYEPAEIARAGVFVSIDADGHLAADRGYVRPEDEPKQVGSEDLQEGEIGGADETAPAAPAQRTVITIGGDLPEEDGDDDAIKPLPERLVSELTAHRTLALRDAVGNNPQVALTALLHKLCLDTFQHSAPGGCLEASVRHVFFPAQAVDLKDSPSAKAVADRHEAWKAELPKDDHSLWDWLAALDDGRRAALLAHCVSFGVNALYEKGDRYGGPDVSAHGVQQRIAQADRLARAVGLDMVEAGWRPTVDNYLGRVTKPRILEAVREAKGDQAAQLIDHLKKAEMAKEAERLLGGTGWLPEPLRLADSADMPDTPADPAEELPAFLAGGEGGVAADEPEPRPIAAD
ncbi:ParB/RepB/Spo0J family partition protein [Reyranella sp.]|jgi:ParB family chromosome partitioning protein|uniref:ParB/RepB/Spo0J family partition protein n=1 Tax=Reyranella sp. TaxID=1929291 RepID=UPI000BCFF68B|nr:ParB/RepB/Spo0J family partition protein [Reyranella sp.]OYY40136.1 MAG: DNA-binding protein [Rhodospirillales bacterium 35-66-84]OYZ92545.1 MAG: DNA-binding protein [Rhodospirillales bacterium 24-66-33]OZB23853.1 MAG: DNA-binding protein [Rhodospirillales bacterium 39-66-50]HQS16970.1 ParB N-terminal domain-containing protein [Reyranella sp.]HQT15059.1 ParB N-terminal domain-containing protein [Reyranella sp.]